MRLKCIFQLSGILLCINLYILLFAVVCRLPRLWNVTVGRTPQTAGMQAFSEIFPCCGRASYQSSLVSFFLSKFAPTLLGFLFAFFILSAKNNVNYYTVKEYYSVIKRTVSRSWSHHLAASSYLTADVGNNTSFTFSSWSAKPACGVKLLSYCFCQMHEKNENKAALTVFLEFFK